MVLTSRGWSRGRRRRSGKRRATRRRVGRGRRRYRRMRVPRNRIPLGFPKSTVAKLRYTEQILLNPATASTIDFNRFRIMSPNDPQHATGGHQPLFWDQFTVGYNHYTVLGARITVKPMPSSVTSPLGTWGIYVDDNATQDYTSVPQLVESNQSRNAWANLTVSNYANKSLRKNFSTSRFFHVNKGALNAGTRFLTLVGNNAAEDAYFIVWYGAPPGAGGVSTYFMVTIDYIVRFSEPKFIAQS